jgi:peptide/nickel transport system substrate-binding protein
VTETPAATGNLDSVNWALPYGEPATLNYLQAGAPSENTVLAPLCESIIRLTPDLEYENGLAETVENPNPKTWIYKLRDGVKFTNGDPMTAEDAVFSISQNLDPNNFSFFETAFQNVESIKATGPLEVTVKLSKPDVLFNQFLATAAGVVVQEKYVKAAGADYGTPKGGVMCTGPFKLTDWTPGRSITIERNDQYWDTENPAKTARIKFEFLTNPAALAAALETGEIDGTYEAPIAAVDRIDDSEAGTLYLGKSTQFAYGGFTKKPGPVQDVRIRQAISESLDRPAIAQTIYKGAAEPITSPYVPASWGYAKETFEAGLAELPDPNTSDIEGAKALVEEFGDVRELKLLVNADDTSAVQLATYIEAQGEQIGIPMQVEALPAAQHVAAAFDPERLAQYDISVSNTAYIDVPDPLSWVVLNLTPDGLFNDRGYSNPTVTRLTEQARGTEDPEKRAELLNQIAAQAYGVDYAQLSVVNYAERLFLNDRITGVPVSLPSYLYYPWARDLGAAG